MKVSSALAIALWETGDKNKKTLVCDRVGCVQANRVVSL